MWRPKPWTSYKSPVEIASQQLMPRDASHASREHVRDVSVVSPSYMTPPFHPLTDVVVDEDVQSEWRVMSPAPGNGSGTAVGLG